MPTSPWIFRQLTGARQELKLEGYAAPFGRPRRAPVADEEIEVRDSEVRYSGNDAVTRHVFGLMFQPMTMNGRWMDSVLGGPGTAKSQHAKVKAFLKAQQPCSIIWGSTVKLSGFMKRLRVSWESQAECAWELELRVDEDLDQPAINYPPPKAPKAFTNSFLKIFNAVAEAAETPETLRVPIQDALGVIVGALLQPIADLQALADEMKSFKEGTMMQLRRFRSGLTMLRNTLKSFRDTLESVPSELMLEFQNTSEEIRLWQSQASTGRLISQAFAEIAAADRAARHAQASRIRSVFTAKDGDTWERLAETIYGDSARANELRTANDAGTSNPVPGETYFAPN